MKFITILLATVLFISKNTNAQSEAGKWYTTAGGEIIFSWANAKQDSVDLDVITRFSPVFNIQIQAHRDFGQNAGFFTGINIRNVGFIFDEPSAVDTRYKARTYTAGVPVALKLGNMKGFFLFAGYEIEFPFNYKQKKFVNEEKVDKITTWFSNRTPAYYNTLFAGFQTKFGTQLKFKYYLTNFFNKNYTADDDKGGTYQPYADIEANVFYVSLSVQLPKLHKTK
jgi:hypothetical protein